MYRILNLSYIFTSNNTCNFVIFIPLNLRLDYITVIFKVVIELQTCKFWLVSAIPSCYKSYILLQN